MRAFTMTGFGPVDRGRMEDRPIPICGEEDLLVRIEAASINPADWKEIEGNLTAFYPPYGPIWTPGHDGAGTVERVGGAVTDFAVGDRVMVLAHRSRGPQSGTLAEYVRVDRRYAARAPTSIGAAAASTIPTAGVTAYQALFRPDIGVSTVGQSLLVHGASGGLGSFAVALGKAAQLRVVATARAANATYVTALGADHVIDYEQGEVVGAVRRWDAGGVDIAIDAASGGRHAELLDMIKPGGRLVVVATVTEDGDIPALVSAGARLGIAVHFLVMDVERIAEDFAGIARLVDEAGLIMPAIATYSFSKTRDALSAMKAGHVRGKIVVEMTDEQHLA